MRRGWKGRRGKENKTCEPALPQPQQGLGGTRRRRRFASSSSSMAGGRGREHARLPAIRISSCKPGTSTCAERGSSGRCSKPSARRCFEWSTAGFSNGRCRVMPGGAAHLTGSPGAVRWAGWCFSRGLILHRVVSLKRGTHLPPGLSQLPLESSRGGGGHIHPPCLRPGLGAGRAHKEAPILLSVTGRSPSTKPLNWFGRARWWWSLQVAPLTQSQNLMQN